MNTFGDISSYGYGYGLGHNDGTGSGSGQGRGYGICAEPGPGFGDGRGFGFGKGLTWDRCLFVGCFVAGHGVWVIVAWGVVLIGCEVHTLDHWLGNWREIAERHDVKIGYDEADEIIAKIKERMEK